MAPQRLLLLRSRAEKERERGRQNGASGARGGIPTGISRSAERRFHDADVRPPRGRRRVERGGRVRARERGGEGRGGWAARLDGPKGRRVAAPASFSFFLNFFSPIIFQTHFDKFKSFFSFGLQYKSCYK